MEDALHEVSRWRSISGLMLLALLLAWESLVPFFSYFAGKVRERVRHGLKNVMLGLLNSLSTSIVGVVNDTTLKRAHWNFSAQEYAAAASDLVSICTHHRETLEKVENEARQISRTLDAVEATAGEREADAIADEAEREQNQLEEYGERLTGILRERLDALTAMHQSQIAAGQAPTGFRPPQMTISTMAAMADSRVHCRTCGGPLDPASGAATCAYCGSPIVPL